MNRPDLDSVLAAAAAKAPRTDTVAVDGLMDHLPARPPANRRPRRLLAWGLLLALATLIGCMIAVALLPARPPVLHLFQADAAAPDFLR